MLKRGNHGEGEVGSMELGADFVLHPLIHTRLGSTLAQDVESCEGRGKGILE
jgi:hypothetical protein